MQRNPLKWQSQAKAWKPAISAIQRDIKALSKHYQTVPLVAGVVKRKVAEPVVFAIQIGKAVSHDAFTVWEDAEKVAQQIADRYDMPVKIVNKKTGAPHATVTKEKPRTRTKTTYAANPMGARGYFVHPNQDLIIADHNLRRLRGLAKQVADATGKPVTVHRP